MPTCNKLFGHSALQRSQPEFWCLAKLLDKMSLQMSFGNGAKPREFRRFKVTFDRELLPVYAPVKTSSHKASVLSLNSFRVTGSLHHRIGEILRFRSTIGKDAPPTSEILFPTFSGA